MSAQTVSYDWSDSNDLHLRSDSESVTYEVFTDQQSVPSDATVAPTGRPLPIFTLRRYAQLAVERATGRMLEDGTCFLEIPDCPGVWAEGATLGEALAELADVVFEWALLKWQDADGDLAAFGDLDLNPS